ncbi:glucokinase [Acidihalobacter prosperus]|uniref:Glucokinase n=1 Tax=Acidihalobacter prosperus TaxID=160660 RepID=A0A1A6C6F6_9GAMM|nr:glucokinase [Acidihalobacter prosperus]OBS10148.1 glucokinase [Acidihalobacter prosperus]
MRLLAGDIGGTKTFLVLARFDEEGGMERLHEARYPSAAHADLAPMVSDFLATAPSGPQRIDAACFALAGPVQDQGGHQQARLTNLPWQLDSERLGRVLDIPYVALINDFAGIGHGLPTLSPDALATLQAGLPDPAAPRLVVGAGTGLGVCTLCPVGNGPPRLLAAEAGHANFAPADARQLRLAEHVLAREGRCTREHLLSGAGLRRVYEFVCAEAHRPPGPALAAGDPPAAIAGAALADTDPLAADALSLFVAIYAGQTADLALAVLPFGGVYLAGGIAPKILPRLRQPDVVAAFTDRPPMQALLDAMPLHVVLDEHAGLAGALEYARRLAAAGADKS